MIQAGLIFPPTAKRKLLRSILHLPDILRPERMSVGEDEPGTAVSDDQPTLDWLAGRKAGFFLKSRECSYDVDIVGDLPIALRCFLAVHPVQIKILMKALAEIGPVFGYACAPEERKAKNRITSQIGINTIESWVGRSIDKALPGLYWWTVLSSLLAEKHGISLSALSSVALEHMVFDNLHLFRFYATPADWEGATEVQQLTADLPGIFDIASVREPMNQAKTFLELVSISQQWK